MTVKFEGQDRREATLSKVLPEYGFKNLEEARDLCLSKGIDVDAIVKGIQPIAFDNASWAYTLGCAIAIKKGLTEAALPTSSDAHTEAPTWERPGRGTKNAHRCCGRPVPFFWHRQLYLPEVSRKLARSTQPPFRRACPPKTASPSFSAKQASQTDKIRSISGKSR